MIDNGDPGFEQIGFNYQSNSQVTSAYDGDNHNMRGGGEEAKATWNFENLADGEYQVAATWAHKYENKYNTIDAPFTIADVGGNLLASTTVDQSSAPSQFEYGGYDWDSLGTVSITGGTLVVTLGAGSNENQYTVADAVRIEQVGEVPPELGSTSQTYTPTQFPEWQPSAGEWEHKGAADYRPTDKLGFTGLQGQYGHDPPGTYLNNFEISQGDAHLSDELLTNLGWSVEQGPQGFNWYNLGDDLGYVAAHGKRVNPEGLPPDPVFDSVSFAAAGGYGTDSMLGDVANWDQDYVPGSGDQRFISMKDNPTFQTNVGYGYSGYDTSVDDVLRQQGGFADPGGNKAWHGTGTNLFEATEGFGYSGSNWKYSPDVALLSGDTLANDVSRTWADDHTGKWWYRSMLGGEDTGGGGDSGGDGDSTSYTPNNIVDWGKDRWAVPDYYEIKAAVNPNEPVVFSGFDVMTDPSGVQWYYSTDNPELGYIATFGISDFYPPPTNPEQGYTFKGAFLGYPDFEDMTYNPGVTHQNGPCDPTAHESHWGGYTRDDWNDSGYWGEPLRNWITDATWKDDPTGEWWYDTDLTDNIPYTGANSDSGGSSSQDGAIPYNYCLDGCLILEYSPKSNPQPIIGGNFQLPYAMSVPERLEARLTFGGVLHDWVHYDTSGLAAGDSMALNLAADVPDLESGRHAYSIEVREITGDNTVTRTISGHRQIFSRADSEFGDRWSLGGLKRIVAGDDGVSVFDGGVGGYWYEEVAGTDQFITPLSQFDTLVGEDGVYAITDPRGNREAFNSLGLLVSTTDRNGNQTVYDYTDADSDGVADEILSITDPYEREKLFDYNSDGRLTSLTNRAKSDNSGGRVTTFEYDAGNLWKIHRPAPDDGITAPVTEFSYDDNGFMTGVREGSASASPTTMVGDFANRLKGTTNADGSSWSLDAALTVGLVEPGSGAGTSAENPMTAITADQSKTTLTDERGFETFITFDRYGGQTSRVDALDNTYLWNRDHHGQVIHEVAPAAGGGTLETSFTYDDRGNLIQTDYADGTHESWAYETSFNQLTSYTDQLNRQTVYDIDPANGNVLAVTRVVGQLDSQSDETDDVTRSFTYTDSSNAVLAGLLLAETDPLGNVTEYEYFDTSNSCGCHSGLLKSITVGLGTAAEATTEYEYDEAGNVSAEIDPLSRRTEYVYDNLDRLIRMTQIDPEADPEADTPETRSPRTLYTYNLKDQLLTETDPLDNVTSYTYDAMGRLETITNKDANGTELSKTSYTYDEAGNLDTEKDELENITRYDYDALGRRIKTTLPDADGDPATTDDIPVLEYTYDAAGNLESETDPLMNVTSYTYDDFGRLKTITNTDSEGGELSATSYMYDSAGNLLVEFDALWNATVYEYDDLGRLIKTTLPDADGDPATTDDIPVFEYAYDAAGNLLSETDPLGNKTSYTYDALGRLVKTTLPDADGDPDTTGDIPVIEYTYYATGQLKSEEDPLGNKTSYDYDDLGRLEAITEADPDGSGSLSSPVTSYTYDAAGQLTSETDPLGNITSYDYDDLGRLETITAPDPDGAGPLSSPLTSYTYDAAGQLKSQTDALGNGTGYDYDALGRLISTTLPDADGDADTTDDIPVFNYTYDAAGNLKTETDPLMNVTSYDYDDLGRLVKTTLPDPDPTIAGDIPVFEYTYDKAGQLTSETDPLGNKTSYDYDDLGRLIQTTLPDPDPTIAGDTPVFEYTYDTAGNLLTEKDALGNGTSYLYDDLGRLETLTETSAGGAALSETGYTYDAAGNRLSLTDPLGNETSWIYDDLNRPIEEQNGSGFSRLMEYDAVGNLTARTDRNDRRIEYGYDDLYRHTTEQWLDENETVIHQFDTAYDRAGQIISAGDGVSDYQYTYDHLGRVTDRAESYEYIKFRIKRHNDYDRMGNRTRTAIKFGGLPGASTETTYDNLYRTTRIEQYGGEVGVPVAEKRVDFSYDQAGQWDTITRYQDLAGQHVAVTTDYAFDPVGRMTGITHAAGDGTVLAGYGWTYDAAQRVKSFDSLIDGETVYDYDDLDQLTGATSDYQLPETYEYDEAGNRTGGPYVTDPLNQLQEDAAYLYRYDNEGNRTARIDKQTGETTLYEWDYRNRLTTISSYDRDPEALDDAVLQQTVTQTYDIWNQWIRRQVDSGSPLIAETYFIYDAGQMVMSFNTLRTSNMAQGRISSANRYLWGPAVDQLLAEEGVRLQGSEGTLWQLTDNLGTVRDLASYDDVTDTTSVVNHITYDAFGNVTNETAAVDHLFGYTGRAYDEETDLQNNHNRWYDAASGKWLSEDPIGFDGGDANLYRYVGNAPTLYGDPDGLAKKLHSWKGTKSGKPGTYYQWEYWDEPDWFEMAANFGWYKKNGTWGSATFVPDGHFSDADNFRKNRFGTLAKIGNCAEKAEKGLEAAMATVIISIPGDADVVIAVGFKLGYRVIPRAGKYIITRNGELLGKSECGRAAKEINNAISAPKRGDGVHRNFGGDSDLHGHSWTRDAPSNQTRDSLGLPNNNTAELQAHGRLRSTDDVRTRRADPLDGNRGGGDEVLVDDPARQVDLDAVTMPDDPL